VPKNTAHRHGRAIANHSIDLATTLENYRKQALIEKQRNSPIKKNKSPQKSSETRIILTSRGSRQNNILQLNSYSNKRRNKSVIASYFTTTSNTIRELMSRKSTASQQEKYKAFETSRKKPKIMIETNLLGDLLDSEEGIRNKPNNTIKMETAFQEPNQKINKIGELYMKCSNKLKEKDEKKSAHQKQNKTMKSKGKSVDKGNSISIYAKYAYIIHGNK